MDRRSRTTFVASVAGAIMLSLTPFSFAWAQAEDPGATSSEGTNIFGNQELPKGLTIVPWKKNTAGELSDTPTRLVDEPLAPIDPDVFERRLKYYEQSRSQ